MFTSLEAWKSYLGFGKENSVFDLMFSTVRFLYDVAGYTMEQQMTGNKGGKNLIDLIYGIQCILKLGRQK